MWNINTVLLVVVLVVVAIIMYYLHNSCYNQYLEEISIWKITFPIYY